MRNLTTVWQVIAAVGLTTYCSATFAEDIDRSITIKSTPPKAWVCQKRRRAFQCHDSTDQPINVSFYRPAEVKYLYVRQLGYNTEKVAVTPSTREVEIALEKSQYLSIPENTQGPAAMRLQQLIDALADYLYERQQPITDQPYTSFAAPIGVVDVGGDSFAHVVVDVGLDYQRKRLKSLYRNKNKKVFNQSLSNVLLEDIGSEYVAAFGTINSTYQLDLDGLFLRIQYPKIKAMLYDDERVENRVTTYAWENDQYRYTSTVTWSEIVSGLKTVDRQSSATYVALLQFNDGSHTSASEDDRSPMEPLMIMSDDNRDEEMRVIDVERETVPEVDP